MNFNLVVILTAITATTLINQSLAASAAGSALDDAALTTLLPPGSCYGDSDCPNNDWCEWSNWLDANEPANCSSTPWNGDCKTYTVLDPAHESECMDACGVVNRSTTPLSCNSSYCIFLDEGGHSPSYPFRIGDLITIASNCVSGGNASSPSKEGQCSTC